MAACRTERGSLTELELYYHYGGAEGVTKEFLLRRLPLDREADFLEECVDDPNLFRLIRHAVEAIKGDTDV